MNIKDLENELIALTSSISDELSASDSSNILEFIAVGEFPIALETLCTQIYEYEIPINEAFYEKVEFIGGQMNLPPTTWLMLKKLIIEKGEGKRGTKGPRGQST